MEARFQSDILAFLDRPCILPQKILVLADLERDNPSASISEMGLILRIKMGLILRIKALKDMMNKILSHDPGIHFAWAA